MVAKWEPKRFIESLRSFNQKYNNDSQSFEEATDELEESLDEGDIDAVNRCQRVVLFAESSTTMCW
jgi:hypothetical protein